VLIAGTAFAQSISTNYMPGTDFSGFHSYKWVAVEGAQPVDQILDQQIRKAVDDALAAKGFTRKDADPVDLYVGYQVAVDQEKELNAFGGGPGWRYWTIVGMNFGLLARCSPVWPRLDKHPSCNGELGHAIREAVGAVPFA